MNETLYLILHRRWFIDILLGRKKEEYREKTPFWTKKLFFEPPTTKQGTLFEEETEQGIIPKPYKYIQFRNGYRKDAPVMIIEYQGINIEKERYAIQLGNIIEKRNTSQLETTLP